MNIDLNYIIKILSNFVESGCKFFFYKIKTKSIKSPEKSIIIVLGIYCKKSTK